MGYTGAGFASGFANTLQTLGPIIQRNQQERESLELQKKLATASLQKHEAETALLTQKLNTAQGLRELLTLGVPGQPTQQFDDMGLSLGQQPGPRVPFDPGNQRHRMLLGAIDPDFAKADIQDQIKQAGIDRRVNAVGPMFQNFVAGMGGGTTSPAQMPNVRPQAPTAPMPTAQAPGQPAAMPQAQVPAPGAALPAIPDQDLSMTFDPATGDLKVTAKVGSKEYKVETGYVDLPDGRKQLWRTWVNPVNGAVVKQEPAGAPVMQQELLKYARVAQSFGLAPGSDAFDAALNDISRAAMLPPDEQKFAMARLADKYAPVAKAMASSSGVKSATATPATTSGGGGGGGSMERGAVEDARSNKVITEALTTAANIQAKLQNEPLEGVSRDKFLAQEAVQRKGIRALELLRPEFVGKPFIDKFKAEFAAAEKMKEYTPGYLAGAMREFFGNASPAEIEFRRTVLEMADDVLRARSGAAINREEYGRISGFIANLSDEPTVFKTAMERIVGEATRMMESTVRVATTPASKLTTGKPSAGKPNFRFDPKTNRLIPVGP